MILEVALLDVKPAETGDFEASFARATSILRAAPEHVSHELRRGVEKPNRYVLLVRWRTLDDHVEGFRKSAACQEWKRLLHHFYEPFPTVEHFEVASGERRGHSQIGVPTFFVGEQMFWGNDRITPLKYALLADCAV